MLYQYNPYIWPLIASALISLFLGIYVALKRRKVKGVNSFMLSMFFVTIWSAGNALEMSSIDFSTKLFWANIQYFAYCYSPVTLLALCMEFTEYDRLIKNRKFLWFAVIPTIIIILVWTDKLHGLIRHDMYLDYNGSFPVIAKKYGPGFFIHALYSHFLNTFALVLVIRAVFFKITIYRRQATALLMGISLIVLSNIMYISGLSPVQRFDITPVFFGPAGIIIAWGIFRFKLFDVIPVARATVIETMDAGVMVLDLQKRVLDINPAFEKIVNMTAPKASARPVEEVCANIPQLLNACTDLSINHGEFSVDILRTSKAYEVLLSPLSDNKGMLVGRLVITNDITERKQAQQKHMKQQWKLAVTEERERLARDMHDNLGQMLGFINLQSQGIRQELKNAGVEIASSKLDKLVDAVRSAHDDMRQYISNVRHAKFMDKDFITALSKEIFNFKEQSDVNVKLDIPSGFTGVELEPNVQINILNILKESLNNVRKHAEAENVRVSLSISKEYLCAAVEDDGKGFGSEHQDDNAKVKYGLSIMRERASEIGAQIEIESVEGKGSWVVLYVPMKGVGSGNANENESDVGR